MSGDEVPFTLRTLAERLQHDLRTLFANAEVSWSRTSDGWWSCDVRADESWGSVGDDYFDESEPDVSDEGLVVHVVEQVVDNLWPDDPTDPWPRCPTHRDHPLHPRISRGEAAWTCLHDPATSVRIGDLT